MMNKFEVKNMDLYYGSFHALKNINIAIPEKEITAFIGPSGCGKSTFLKSLNSMNDLVEGCRISGDILLIVWFGGKQIDAGTMQVGSMIAFITYTMQIVMSFLMLTMVAVMLPRAGVAADRIDEVLTTEPAIHDPVPEAIPADLNQHHWNGEVAFHHVLSLIHI